jgi:hypothetical protein
MLIQKWGTEADSLVMFTNCSRFYVMNPVLLFSVEILFQAVQDYII